MKINIKKLLLFFIFGIVYISSYTQTTKVNFQPLIEKYRKIIQTEMKKNYVIGTSIALVCEDSLIWVESFGYRDVANNIKMKNSDQYLLASITKTFTGIGVMQLQANGKLDINNPLKQYLPEFNIKMLSGNINDITIKNIMTHHSGIPSDILANFAAKNPEPTSKLLDYLNNEYLSLKPNSCGSYSNVAVSLLGLMIEKISGQSYTDYIKSNIFMPLSMNSSGFYTANEIPEGVKFTYDDKGKPSSEYPLITVPASSIYSNVNDMANYIKAVIHYGKFQNKQIIDSISLVKMFEEQNENVPLDLGNSSYLIWDIAKGAAGILVRHSGATLQGRSYLSIAPQSKLGIIMICNSQGGLNYQWRFDEILNEAAKLKGYKAAKVIEKDSASIHYYTTSNKNKFKKVKLSSKELQKYSGDFLSPTVGINFIIKGNKLLGKAMGQKFYLIPVTGNNFIGGKKVAGMMFTNKNQIFYFDSIQGKYYLITRYDWGGKSIVGEFHKKENISDTWRKRIGDYQIVNLKEGSVPLVNKLGKLKINEGFLTYSSEISIGVTQKFEIPFEILSDNLAQTAPFGRNGGSKLQVIQKPDGSENLMFFGYELKRIIGSY